MDWDGPLGTFISSKVANVINIWGFIYCRVEKVAFSKAILFFHPYFTHSAKTLTLQLLDFSFKSTGKLKIQNEGLAW